MTKVFAIANQKGGVGKTTTTANLAYAYANMGKKVLLIDFDSQGSLTNYFNIGKSEDEDYFGIYELMVHQLRPWNTEEDTDIPNNVSFGEVLDNCVYRPSYKEVQIKSIDGVRKAVDVDVEFGVDLIPSNLYLASFEVEMSQLPQKPEEMYKHNLNSNSEEIDYNYCQGVNPYRLSKVIEQIKEERPYYDYIFIDCNPSLGLLTVNAIMASVNGVIIPTNLDLMSTRGVGNLITVIVQAQKTLQKSNIQHMGVVGIVLNLYSDWRIIDKEIKYDINRFFPFKIFDSTIPESTDAKKAVRSGVIYSQWNKKAKVAYEKLAKEIEKHVKQMEIDGPKILMIGQDEEK